MKKSASIALAAMIFSGCLGSAYAQTTGAISDKNVSVIYLAEADKGSEGVHSVPTITHQKILQAQEELRADNALRSFLQQKRVELNNVIIIEKAANGDRIVYVR
ncbi:hypothetical protein [Neorhizobium sp. DT-125]|uniref:hypothetical protein n=1 Tax=Neorhizobium sp. DT-125 TaxID=3396163 RepID=UPI003F1960FA